MIRTLIELCLLSVVIVALTGCSGQTAEQQPRLIPMEDFFKNPKETGYDLSPDGKHVAFLKPWESRLNVHVIAIGGTEPVRITSDTDRDIRGFAWANDNRIVYFQDSGGDENFHAFAADIDGGNVVELTPFDGVKVRMVDDLEDNEEEMLISMNRRNPQLFDVYRINIVTGAMSLVAENPGNIMGWVTDNDGLLRAAVATDGINTSLLYRAKESDPFQVVITTSFKNTLDPLFFTFDNKYLYVTSNMERDKQAIFKWDPETGEHMEMVFEHPEVDVARLLRSRERELITGVSFTTDKRHYHFFDEQRENLQAFLETQLPGYEAIVVSMSRDETKVLVRTFSDKSLGAYYYYDTVSGDFEKLVDVSPWIDENELADMKPVQYTSRDGKTINGYLTLPRGVAGTNLPVVVNPHGGPWARDNWGFNPEIQFLANRGYAVLQMNFRGSTGYGKEFWTASFKEWGKTMQDDISDGVQYLIDEGIADPARVGIYGGSYGGYAVLSGLAFTPELYACGVDYVGVSNLFTFMETFPPYWEPFREMMYEMVGHPEEEKELLEAASPIFHVDKMTAPLLVAQGANDPRVNIDESNQMVEALKARGIDVPYIVKDNEGHGFGNEENRFDLYRAMEQFLAKHLGGRAEVVAGS